MSAARRAEVRTNRLRQWRNGWAMALLMARRDVRRDWGRSLFVWLMIVLPIGVIAALLVVVASNTISAAERLDLKLGTAHSVLTQVGYGFQASWDGYGTASSGGKDVEPRPIPGWGNTVAEHQDAVAALIGRPAVAVTETYLEFGKGQVTTTLLGIDPESGESMFKLISGRNPQTSSEALVTPNGMAAGLPASGTVTLVRDGVARTVTIVGIADAHLDGLVELVGLPEADADRISFFVAAGTPLAWTEAQNLAGYGFETASRGIAADPPSGQEFHPSELGGPFLTWMVILAAMIEVALVVGPAFAIGAARQRRGLALAASNGASIAQLRRSALGQALLLGVSGATLGAALGAGVGVLVWQRMASEPTELHGPLEVPWTQLAGVLALGTLTAVAAALVTARGLARLDLVGSLRGSLRSAPVRKGAPVLGGVLVGAGLVGVWLAMLVAPEWRFLLWTVSALAVLIGVLLCVPALLGVAARLAGGAPMGVRMALRDTSRQRGRATSTVAAILAGGLILGTVWTLVLSFEADAARRYQPSMPLGQASLYFGGESAAGLRQVIADIDPVLRTYQVGQADGRGSDPEDPQSFAALRPGCTTDDLPAEAGACASLSSDGGWYGQGILIAKVDELTELFGLDASQRKELAAGKLLVATDTHPNLGDGEANWAEHQIVNGAITFAYATIPESGPTQFELVEVPASPVAWAVIERGASVQWNGALISSESAANLGWVSRSNELRIVDPRGAISPELEARLKQAITPWGNALSLSVERGYQSQPQPVLWGVTATLVLLAVVAAVIATVMSTIELRPFLGTFAAIGAGPGLSRRLAATQAVLLGVIGTTLGCGIGAVVAVPLATSVTGRTDGFMPPVVDFPWLLMAGLVLGIPALAAIVAALCVPARPMLVRRAT